MTLAAAITRIQVHADACTGVKFAPAAPPEALGATPAVFAYPIEGSMDTLSNDNINSFHTIAVDYVTPRTLLDVAQERVIVFVTEFPKKLALDPTLAAAVTTIVFPVTYSVFDVKWDTTEVRIVRFRVPVKLHEAAS